MKEIKMTMKRLRWSQLTNLDMNWPRITQWLSMNWVDRDLPQMTSNELLWNKMTHLTSIKQPWPKSTNNHSLNDLKWPSCIEMTQISWISAKSLEGPRLTQNCSIGLNRSALTRFDPKWLKWPRKTYIDLKLTNFRLYLLDYIVS